MKNICTLLVAVTLCASAKAQADTTKPAETPDTLRVGNLLIVKGTGKSSDDKEENRRYRSYNFNGRRSKKQSDVSTNWLILDLGFANYSNQTDFANTGNYIYNRPGTSPIGKSDFTLNTGKSINVNIWFFMQQLNLVKHHVHLKYGLGLELNNYRYKSNISYLESNPFVSDQAPAPVIIRDSVSFSKNKLAADYLTVPFMISFRTSPYDGNRGLSISAGVSAGYLYSQRNKQVSNERGKQTNKGNYDLEQFKFSYIAELGLGPVKLYGSYTPKSIYQNGMDIRPYTIGFRLSNW
ncbi:MAG TPA: hypothetical protein PKC39_01230 [Ferruginibacter sp.]|nr:hypothetical protein [Ferruginibacter sp.]HMP19555.1 hypothetical protein [Ferruginibacter sp.]